MILLPVISRELRAASRHGFTYYLRVLGVGALLLVSLFFCLDEDLDVNGGGQLFSALHVTLFSAIWLLVPLLTADCISRERREGTLGLLFLTGLSSSDIVVAKSLAYGLRALTLWLAVLPVFTIPFLLGGLTWAQTALSAMVNFSSLCMALAAGLLASAWSKAWLRTLVRAVILSVIFLALFGWGVDVLLSSSFAPGPWAPGERDWQAWYFMLSAGNSLIAYQGIGTGGVATFPRGLLVSVVQLTVFSALSLLLAILLAGRKTRRVWQEEPPSALGIWWQETFCTPILWRSFFQRWLQRKLARNPIGWLEQRTWTGRLVTWGWFAVVISLYSAIFTDRNFFRGYSGMQIALGWMLTVSMGITAAGSFRRERETGVMELLLVSPLREADIIWGRLRGLWGQFVPAVGLLLGVWLYFSSLMPDSQSNENVWFFGITFMTLPIIGLYYSLRCANFLSALLATLAMGVLVPILLASASQWMVWKLFGEPYYRWAGSHLSASASFWQLLLAGWFGSRLLRRLKKRSFPLERAERGG